MLKEITIKKLFNRFDYTLSFPEEGIMIITGPNGYGKSTILRIINSLCNDDVWKVFSYPFKKLIISCDNATLHVEKTGKTIKVNNVELSINNENIKEVFDDITVRGIVPATDLFYLKNIDNSYIDNKKINMIEKFLIEAKRTSLTDFYSRQFIRDEDAVETSDYNRMAKKLIRNYSSAIKEIDLIKKSIGKVHFIQEQRLIEKKEPREEERRRGGPKAEFVTVISENSEKLKTELAEIMKKHSTLSSNLDSSYIKRLFEADQSKKDSPNMIERLRELQEKQDKLQKYGLAEIQNASYLNQLDKEKLKKFGIELSIYLEDANAKYQLFEEIINKLDLYERIVNEKLSFKKMYLSSTDGIVVKTDEDVKLALNDLSSGEQEILVLFYKLIFESDVNLLLIDEPEISLHIAWQKELMENLKSIVALKKNIQVIIATHSPQILSHNWDLQRDLGGLHNG